MRERASVVAAAVVALGLSSSASAEVVELKQLEQRALEHHSLLQAGAARERAAAATVKEAESAYMPRIGFNVDSNLAPGRRLIPLGNALVQGANAFDSDTSKKKAVMPSWRTTGSLVVGANLYDFGRTQSAVAATRARHDSTKAEQEMSKAQVVASVRAAYLTWLSTHQLHGLAAGASQDGSQRSQRVNALVQEGARPRAELAPVEADRLLSELELERATGELEAARMLLEQSVGEQLSVSAEPDLRILELEPAAAASDRPADPALRVLVHQRAALEATARMQRREGFPVLSASAAVGAGVQTNLGESDYKILPSYVVGLGLSIPIWDGGGSRAAAAATDAQADELRLRLESTESERDHERKRAQLDAEHALKRQQTAEKLLAVCTTRVADVEAGYELGAMQFDQVQQARAMLRRAQTEVVLAKVARAEAVLRFAP